MNLPDRRTWPAAWRMATTGRLPLVLFAATMALSVIALCTLILAGKEESAAGAEQHPPVVAPAGPPWRYGRADARFTIIQYADLRCAYCRQSFPILKQFVDAHPDVNWQWHHLPLPAHEPSATHAARIAECAGETSGAAGFWTAIEWLYEAKASDLQAPKWPGMSATVPACVRSGRADAIITAQAESAQREQITATPTIRLLDRQTGKGLTLQGLVEDEALLSAIDLLTSPE